MEAEVPLSMCGDIWSGPVAVTEGRLEIREMMFFSEQRSSVGHFELVEKGGVRGNGSAAIFKHSEKN